MHVSMTTLVSLLLYLATRMIKKIQTRNIGITEKSQETRRDLYRMVM